MLWNLSKKYVEANMYSGPFSYFVPSPFFVWVFEDTVILSNRRGSQNLHKRIWLKLFDEYMLNLSRLYSVNTCKLRIAYLIAEDEVDEMYRAPLLRSRISNMKGYQQQPRQNNATLRRL